LCGFRAFANLLAREGYALSDSVGVQGLEAVYEERLRGEKGIERQLQDALSLVIERAVETPAAPGDTLQLTLDLEMQRRGVELLDGRPGALVAVDPRDGGVLALVSSPGFDSDQPVTGRGWGAIATDNVGRPLVNRALREIYSPGSTLKPIVALGALRDDAIEPDTTFFCEGSIEIGGHRFGCDYKDGCGWLSVRRALARSCNVFFYNTMHSSRPRLGQEGWQRVCAEFGLFSPTGIDLPGEVAGHMPQRRLYTGEVIQLGIGQGPFDVTPLQMVMAYARLATGKAFNQPHLVVSATGTGGSVHWQRSPPPNANLPLPNGLMSPERDLVLEGMADVVRTVGGTANRVNFPAAWRVAGKTGSAENRGQIDSWFIAFAPWDDPQIVVGCVVEGAGHGGDVAAPIVRDFLREHFEAPAPQAPELAALP
jgi:penicillin-binding protein 2